MAIIISNNGQTTILTSGEQISSITPEPNTYVLGVDSITGEFEKLNPNGNIFNFENISGGTGQLVIETTYADLYATILSETLIPGSWYRLTDYRSVNFLNGWEIANNNPTPVEFSFNPREVVTGDTSEVLILQAVSSSEISPIGYSESFPQDIITYLPLVNKIGVNLNISNGYALPDLSVVSGFDLQWDGTNVYFDMPTGYPALYGHYFYLYCSFDGGNYYQQGVYEPLLPNVFCQYPFTDNKTISRIKLENGGMKVILLDLVEADFNLYDTNTLYVEHIEALDDAYGWITKRQDTLRNITAPLDFRGRKYRRFEVEVLGNITGISYTTQLNPLIDGTYYVYDTSGHSPNAGFTVTVAGNLITDISIYIPAGGYFVGDTINILGTDIGGASPDDDIVITVTSAPSIFGYYGRGDNFNNRVTTGNYKDFKVFREDGYETYNIEWNDIGGPDMSWYAGYNDNNVFLGHCYSSKIGTYFNNNTIEYNFYYNTIGNDFYNNTIEYNFYYNTIGNDFYNNTIEYNFYYNTIGYDFQYNTIGGGFNYNTIGGGFNYNTIGNFFNSSTIGNFFNSSTIGNNFNYNTIGDYFNSNTIGNLFQSNTIGNFFQSNTVGDNSYYNTIGDYFNSNTIGNLFQSNTIGNFFQSNTIGYYFYSNTIGNDFSNNTIGNDFYSNTIGNNFNSNTIGVNFRYNTIGNNFNSNTIGVNFRYNTIGDYFNKNITTTNFNSNKIKTQDISIDFTDFYGNITGFTYSATGTSAGDNIYLGLSQNSTTGIGINATFDVEVSLGSVVGVTGNTQGKLYAISDTLTILGTQISGTDGVDDVVITITGISPLPSVYEPYTCDIFERQGGTKRLSYYDSSDILTITNINE